MKKTFAVAFWVSAAMLWIAAPALCPTAAYSRSVFPVQDAKFNTAMTIRDNLKNYIGKETVIHLKSGKSLQGYVKAVGDHLVHIEKLAGRDFYDALIRIDDISAMEAKFRELK